MFWWVESGWVAGSPRQGGVCLAGFSTSLDGCELPGKRAPGLGRRRSGRRNQG